MAKNISMDYIHSSSIYMLLRDTLKLIDAKPMDHGFRTAYILYKMLKEKGKLEEFELADFIITATFHDMGAYEMENLSDVLRYETRDYMPHSIYGYLFYKHMWPILDEDRPKIYLYHHMHYEQMRHMNFSYLQETSFLNVAEKMDLFHNALGEKFDYTMFAKESGTKLSKDGLELFYTLERRDHLLEKLKDGSFREEMDEAMKYMIFTNDHKQKYMEVLMYMLGFRSHTSVVDAVTTINSSLEIAKKLGMSEAQQDILRYAAIVHDIGMLAIPKEIIEAPRKLTDEEMELLRTHVHRSEQLLRGKITDEIVDIATAHHERLDGSGYPKGLTGDKMSLSQQILQVADTISGLYNERSYRKPKTKEQIISILQEEAERGKYSDLVVDTFVSNYDEIMEKVKEASGAVVGTYERLNDNYKLVMAQFGHQVQ